MEYTRSSQIRVSGEVGTHQALIPAATRVADGRPLLDRPRIPPLSLQLQEAQGYVLRCHAIVFVGGRDTPLTGSRPVKRPQQHVSIDLLVYEQVNYLIHILLGPGTLHRSAQAPPVFAPAGADPPRYCEHIIRRSFQHEPPDDLPVAAALAGGHTDPGVVRQRHF